MSRTVFWSWQSDTPKRETRDIIHSALEAALKDLSSDLVEAMRAEIDQGTKGVEGMELIAEEILRKIDEAFAFVADITAITVIGEGPTAKWLPNPNVMLELGYARRSLTRRRVIAVFNTAFGPPRHEELPFDLRHLSGSIAYSLPKGAPRQELGKQREYLRKRFAMQLKAMIGSQTVEQEAPQWHERLPSDPSVWEEAYNPLPVSSHAGRQDVIVASGPRLYARLLPAHQASGQVISGGLFPNSPDHLKPIGDRDLRGLSGGQTANGYAIYQPVGDDRVTKTIARWYEDNGEIWAVSTHGFYAREGQFAFALDEVARDLMRWVVCAQSSARAAGGDGPFSLRLGAVGLERVFWEGGLYDPQSNLRLGLRPSVEVGLEIASGERQEVVKAVLTFVNAVAKACGVPPLQAEAIAGYWEQ